MNFKNNIERCKAAQKMGYRVDYAENNTGDWLQNNSQCDFSGPEHAYRVHPDDEEMFQGDLAAREEATRRQSEPTHTEVNATNVETPDDSLEVLAKLLPLLGSLPGVTADITITLHIKV